MKVSVVIAAWNNQAMLDKTLRDLSRQTRKPDEIVVVDDGSDTPLHSNDVWMVWLDKHSEPRTSGFARNEGVKVASGDVIIFCDHDQALVSDAIESLTARDDCIITARRYGLESDTDDPDETYRKLHAEFKLPNTPFADMEHCLAMIPRYIFDDVGGYDTEAFRLWGWTNYDFSRRAMAKGHIIAPAINRNKDTLYTFNRPHGFVGDLRGAANEYHTRYGHLSLNQECDECYKVGLRYAGNGVSNIPVFSDEDYFDSYKQAAELARMNERTDLGVS